MRHPFYLLFGALVLGAFWVAEMRGYTLLRPTRVSGVPRSVRENPGAYRSVYVGSSRYPRGK